MTISSLFIAVDWGTSHLRAYLCQVYDHDSYSLIEQRDGPGVVKANQLFEQTLLTTIEPWTQRYGILPIYIAGQITSSIGWHETPYLECPINPEKLLDAAQSFQCAGHIVKALPGTKCTLQNELMDVMRGEELQILGFLKQNPKYQIGEVLLCLPGTHTKWVLLNNGKIMCFKTAMTGELYDLLCHQSVLIPNEYEAGDFDWNAFEQGCELTLNSDNGNLAHGIFSVRTRQLANELTPVQAKAYLSGVLIGSDVRAARHATEWNLLNGAHVAVIGTHQLNRCFTIALEKIGVSSAQFDIKAATLQGFNYLYEFA